jgi:carboxyl-terminal processing protease
VAALVPVLAVGLFIGGAAADRAGLLGAPVGAPGATATPAPGEVAGLDLVEEAWRSIRDNYVDAENLDDRELAYGAIRGLVDAVGDDGHTTFLTAEEAKAVDESLSGTFVGIGVQVSGETDEILIGSVIPNTPAEEAGLRRGDRILAVDGDSTAGETIDEVVARVRGPEGEKVTLTVGRAGIDDFDVTIVRRRFDLPMVSWSMVPGRTVAYVRLEQFATGATEAMKAALDAAKADGATALVLDLRANPGGYVNEAGITSQFVGEAPLPAVQRGKEEEVLRRTAACGPTCRWGPRGRRDGELRGDRHRRHPDANRGTVVGETTFDVTVLGRLTSRTAARCASAWSAG